MRGSFGHRAIHRLWTATLRQRVPLILVVLALITSIASARAQDSTPLRPPPAAPVRPVPDDYFGTKVVDNYRYFENLKDPEVSQWMKAQADYTQAVLATLPGRERLLARMRELAASRRAVLGDVWRRPGDRYFYLKRLAGENATKLYERDGLAGPERLLVDPPTVSLAPSNQGKGPSTIEGVEISGDSRYIAVGITPGGAELNAEIHVIETGSGKETGDVIFRPSGSLSWLPDNRSFVYSRGQDLPADAPRTALEQKDRSYLHSLGTDARRDPAVFGYGVTPSINVDSTRLASVEVASRYALGFINSGRVSPNSEIYIAPVDAIGKPDVPWRKVAGLADQVKDATVHGDDLYVISFKNASRYKILRTDARHPDLSSAEVVVPPTDAVVETMSAAQDALYVQVLDGGIDRILRVPYGPSPKVENVVLPLEGTATPAGSDPRVPGILLRLISWTDLGNLYSYDPQTRQVTNTQLEQLGRYSRDDNTEAVNVKVKSYDGTLVPLSIIYPKGIKLDGSHPTLLDGYGAYGIVIPPGFGPLPPLMAWTERGGILAECRARGGGEYGEDWHLAGKGVTKPNTWRDFIACAEYLIDKKYTSPAHLAGIGGSAGGILIGRAIEERPDLFAAAVANVPAADMLRFETTASGTFNIPEFGSTKTEAGFRALYAMSAYANVKDGVKYPAVLVTTGMNDPRVDPWEPAKFAARLQAATASGKPVLLRVDYTAGHGLASTPEQLLELRADMLSFVLWQTGDPAFQPREQ